MGKKSAFSLVEVIVAAVVFTLSAAAIFGALRSLAQRRVSDSSTDVRGVAYGQVFLESLRNEVYANRWGDAASPLKPGGPYNMPTYAEFPGYNGTYTVVDDSGSRKVTANINTP